MLVHAVDGGVVVGRSCRGVSVGWVGGGCVVIGGSGCSGRDVRVVLMCSWSLIVCLMRV